MKKRNERFRSRIGLTALFSMIVFVIFLITALIMGAFIAIAMQFGLGDQFVQRGPFIPVLMLLLISVIVGTVVSFMISKFPLRPIRKLIAATNRLADGDFSVRLEKARRMPPEFVELTESFNRMAQELGNIEMLRTDFVNNFSHEFKTPIVSIKGFAEMLKYGNLTDEEQNEYLDIVISESSRLSSLATNVLNLSKIEGQTILSEQQKFNVGEQIRGSIILLQPKWEAKHLEVSVDGEDLFFVGNEDLLGQVWVNLLDNAIKFSPENERITISIGNEVSEVIISIYNSGAVIPFEAQHHIFDKFYQVDTSHATSGNGLGLTLVKKIVELHRGNVSCESSDAGTTFTVRLPIASR